MKRWKYVRANLAQVGYTTIESASAITITNIDSTGYLFYTDEHGSAVKVLYPSSTPIVVDSTTTSISFTDKSSTVYLAGKSGYTYSLGTILNQESLDVTSECVYYITGSTIATVAGAAITNIATITAAGSGSTTVTVQHNDGPTGYTTISVGQYNSSLSASGGTLDTLGTGAFQVTAGTIYYLSTGVTIKNQLSRPVNNTNSTIYYTIGGTDYTNAWTAATGITAVYVKDTYSLAAGLNTGVTYVVTVV